MASDLRNLVERLDGRVATPLMVTDRTPPDGEARAEADRLFERYYANVEIPEPEPTRAADHPRLAGRVRGAGPGLSNAIAPPHQWVGEIARWLQHGSKADRRQPSG